MWREVKVVGVGNVASLFSARAFVWGDVDPHGGGLAVLVNSEAIARACVVLELEQVRDGQSQLLAVPRYPVLNHFLLVDCL